MIFANISPRPAYIRGIDVWNFPAPEEDEAYENHSHVVQALSEVVSMCVRIASPGWRLEKVRVMYLQLLFCPKASGECVSYCSIVSSETLD